MVRLWGLSTHKVFEDARNKFINLLFFYLILSLTELDLSFHILQIFSSCCCFSITIPLTYYLTKNRSNCIIEKCSQYYYIVEFCCDSVIPLREYMTIRSSSVYWFSGIPDLDNDGSMIELRSVCRKKALVV